MNTKEKMSKKVCSILLGCDKNRVDLEKMLFSIKQAGFEIVSDPEDCDVLLIQTCAFILPARKEAVENILYGLSLKQQNKIEKLIVSGCFPQKNLSELQEEFPEVDAFVVIKQYPVISNIIEELYNIKPTKINDKNYSRLISTPSHFAYLKIADGCDNCCAYCTIPRIRGRYISTPIQDIVNEAEELANKGVRELILVAQDVTRYGQDLYNESRLLDLLEKLVKIKKITWIRLHYCYPELITKELLDFIYTNDKMCKYLDIPLQHIDNDILHSMNRRSSEQSIRNLIANIKCNYPKITLRTTFIVGFPGENNKKFNKLVEFVKSEKLDCVGFFPFSREENTKAFYLKNQYQIL